jgi:two-component system, chemotaxis family, response regulator Rcp1
MTTNTPLPQIFHIMLLEDNLADIYLLRRALKNAGVNFELTVIEDGADGLAFARRQGKYEGSLIPDLAVLDLNLPKGGGESVLIAMRRSSDLDRVPVVIISSSAAPSEQASVKDLGVEQFIKKPANLEVYAIRTRRTCSSAATAASCIRAARSFVRARDGGCLRALPEGTTMRPCASWKNFSARAGRRRGCQRWGRYSKRR